MARSLILGLLLVTLALSSPTKKELRKEKRAWKTTSSCTKEVCARARTTLKVNADCIKTPFCVRALLKDLKKATKEKARLLKTGGNERKCAGKSRGGSPKESRPNKVESAGLLTQFNALVLQHEDMIKKNKELAEQIESLSSQNKGFSTQKKDLITQKKALSAKNKSLLSQTKDLTLKNDELERQVGLLKERTESGSEDMEEFEKQVEEAREEAKKMRERNVEVVSSLERVETQYAMMGQKLSEAVEAMSTIKNKVEEMRSELEEKNYENQELQSELKVCSTRLESLGEVNSGCREKLGELQICKSEIGRLAAVVEERFSRVKAENKEEQQLRMKALQLEENLNKAEADLERLSGEMETCIQQEKVEQDKVKELEERLVKVNVEAATKREEIQATIEMEKNNVIEEQKKAVELTTRIKEIESKLSLKVKELDTLKTKFDTELEASNKQKNELKRCLEKVNEGKVEEDKGRLCNSPCMISKIASNDLIEMSQTGEGEMLTKGEVNGVTEETFEETTQRTVGEFML